MKKAKDILKEMAFNPNAPSSTRDAFLKHLQKSLQESTKAEVIPLNEKEMTPESQQLSFDIGEIKDLQSTKVGRRSS